MVRLANGALTGACVRGGTYSLDGLAPGDYTVRAATPAGYDPVGPSELDADLVASSPTGVDFDLTLVKYPASGTVTADGTPVSGAIVTCLDPTGTPIGSALTDSSRAYACPPVPPGTGYSVVLTVPEGYAADGPVLRTFDVVEAAVTGLEFALTVPPPVTTGTSSTATSVTTETTETTATAETTETTGTTETTETTGRRKRPGPPRPPGPRRRARLSRTPPLPTPAPDTSTSGTTSESITPDTTTSDSTTDTPTTDSTRTVVVAVTWTIADATSDEFVADQTDDTYDDAYDSESSYDSEQTYDSEQSYDSALATTGSPIESLLPVGAALLLGGGVLMLLGRRARGVHR